jgi:hypothetical protein
MGNDEETYVIVEWIDCTGHEDLIWRELAVAMHPIKTVSGGILLHKDEDKVVMATDVFSDGRVRGVQVFPMSQVVKITFVTPLNSKPATETKR